MIWKIAPIFMAMLFLDSSPSEATPPHCNTRDGMLEMLAAQYREAPVAVGVTNSGGLVEVVATGDGDTWTIIVTTAQGMSCVIAAGEAWRDIAKRIRPGIES